MSMWNRFLAWGRAVALLRHPELQKELGELRLEVGSLNALRNHCPGCIVERGVVLSGYSEERCDLGDRVKVCRGTVLAFGDECGGFGRIVVGDRTWIGQYNNFRAVQSGDIKIGADCLISQFCTLVTAGHGLSRETVIRGQKPSALGAITLGNDVWLGAGVTVLPGVTIGEGAVIGANSVVTCAIPPYEIWAGSPARKIHERCAVSAS